MTAQSGLQSRQQRQALFAQRGHIAANAAKGLGSSHAAEAPRDLLLDFDHAQISLRLIGRTTDSKVSKANNSFLLSEKFCNIA